MSLRQAFFCTIQIILMKKILLLLALSTSLVQAQHVLTERLQKELNSLERLDAKISIRIEMLNKIDAFELHKEFVRLKTPINERAIQTVVTLQEQAKNAQQNILNFISAYSPSVSKTLRNYWIVNVIYAEASSDLIYELGHRDDVAFIDLNSDTSSPLEEVETAPLEFNNAAGLEPGLIAINAPALWNLGYTGKGLLVYDYDTGVSANHPAFKERFLANRFPMDQSWYGHFRDFPNELNSNHGTHTLGTMIGQGLPSGDTIGVAPGAYWIACDLVTTTVAALPPLENIVAAYQWALDADNNPQTTLDIPNVINNSWRWRDVADTVHCNDYIVDLMNALEAAGIASVFSGGNSGPDNSSVNAPQRINTTIVNTFSVGSINANQEDFAISTFSTRGPLQCPTSDSSLIIHPEVVAPGQGVRSSVGLNLFDSKSGTSMAAPHVSGAVLLLKEAFPALSGADILTALYYTANDMGIPGEDNTYGMGLIDCLAAFEYLSLSYTPSNPFETPYDVEVLTILEPQSETHCSSLVNPSFEIRNNGDSTVYTMNIVVNLNGEPISTYIWEGNLPSGQTMVETIPGFTLAEELDITHELQVKIALINQNENDEYNNVLLQRFSWNGIVNAPFIEDFENNTYETNLWNIKNPDQDRTWEIAEAGGLENSNYSALMNMYNYLNTDQRDLLTSPNINLNESEAYSLYFSYAHHNKNVGSKVDSLIVEVSSDCGANYQVVFAKGGNGLETTDTLDLNFEPSYPTHWENAVVNLEDFIPSSANVLVRFTSVNARQNNLYLDNIIVSTPEEFSSKEINSEELYLYPNPATNSIQLIFKNTNSETQIVRLVDLTGRILESKLVRNNTPVNWDLTKYQAGFYLFQISSDKGVKTQSFVKN